MSISSSDSKIIYESEDFNLIITFAVENGNIKLFNLYEINEETNAMIRCDSDYQLFDWDLDYDII